MKALHRLHATDLACRLSRGEVSSAEVTATFLDRIERLDPALGAFAHVAAASARRAAAAFDRARSRGRAPSGPLAGVPIAVKDLYPVRGMPLHAGSRAFAWAWSPVDGPNVHRLRAAGAVIVGKLATAEFGAMPFTDPDIGPSVRNPWDLSRTAGGSSGGTAAAVAARLLPLGHASDGGGSIRIPAALCGLFGFKPSRGAVHHASPLERLRLSAEGPIARSVDDACALLQALSVDARFVSPAPLPSGLRVKLLLHADEPGVAATPARAVAATRRIAALLEQAGCHVEETHAPPLCAEDFLPLWQRTFAGVPLAGFMHARLQPVTRALREAGRGITAAQALVAREALAARLADWWGHADLLVTPTVACEPPVVGIGRGADPAEVLAQAVPLAVFTAAFNVTGQPAMSVPVAVEASGAVSSGQIHPVAGRSRASDVEPPGGAHAAALGRPARTGDNDPAVRAAPGSATLDTSIAATDGRPAVPSGVQVVGRVGEDARLLAVARVLEGALGGLDHDPPGWL
jgi:amidase